MSLIFRSISARVRTLITLDGFGSYAADARFKMFARAHFVSRIRMYAVA